MSSSTPSTVISSSMDSEENQEIIKSCENGAIAPEQAIPGAYQTSCTRLPSREILLKTKEDASTIINIAQESTGPGQTGMTIWNSGLILVRLFEAISLSDPQWFRSKTLVELGCGTGLASIAAAKMGAKSIFATDGNPNVIKLATDNIMQNDVAQIVQPSLLSWGFLNAMDLSETADVVFGSDLTYNSGTWRVLSETMSTVLKEGGFVVYVSLGHPGFNANAELDGFLSVARSQNLVALSEVNDQEYWPLPFALSSLSHNILSSKEREIIDSNGGYRVLVLQKRVSIGPRAN
eukprot:CAMPEP_0178919220 /NCGR_PEP_ID=MMETSP0786-20121207/14311_1 /TAXON_ID=186022 /ORGANISM="Thalassionema frauenfeldii, Strain CCMP 1798" /LENGTH=291 /DNA_ID=CAMNT_0020593117 /DNA_START=85 /DNA_END=960 /DNA_ORIENTATION=+